MERQISPIDLVILDENDKMLRFHKSNDVIIYNDIDEAISDTRDGERVVLALSLSYAQKQELLKQINR